MRILLRKDDENDYVWKEATYKSGRYFIMRDKTPVEINELCIVAIDGQAGQGCVVCNNCGEMIENTPAAIAAHYAKMESERDCHQCQHLAFSSDKKQIKRVVSKNADGTYNVKDEFESDELFCGARWSKVRISSPEINRYCTRYECRRRGMGAPQDIFSRLPGVFDTSITVDTLTAKKFKFEGYNGHHFVYDLKSRGTIKALVNKSGIVDAFLISSNGTRIMYFYSEKYDKLFFSDGSRYCEGKPHWFREAKFDEAYKKIKALYEGAK